MGQLTKREKVGTLRDLLASDAVKEQIALAAPRHLSPDRIIRIAMTSIQQTPALLDCTKESLLGSLLTCTQLGLAPDSVAGQAHLIPYKDKCTLIVGYRGLMELARRSGEITALEARVVYEGDAFDYEYGLDGFCRHKPKRREPDDELRPTHVYAYAKLANGEKQFEVMDTREVEAIRKRSRAGTAGPWVTDWAEMAKKTVMRRLCKYLPSSPELQAAVSLDEEAERGIPQNIQPLEVEVEEPKQKALATAAKPKPDGEQYKEIHGAAMALHENIRAQVFGEFGLKLVTDAKALDVATANDLLIALRDAAKEGTDG
jgi:recombination protein RecT